LVEVTNEEGKVYNVICYQRSNLCDTLIVVGDTVDLTVVTPPEGNSTVAIDTNSMNNNVSSIHEQNIDNISHINDTDKVSNIDPTANGSPLSSSNEDDKSTSISLTHSNEIEKIDAVLQVDLNIQNNEEKLPVNKDNSPPSLPLQGVVLRHHERLNLLERPAAFDKGLNSKNKAIAANIEQIILVVSAIPVVPLSSIDRILVAAHEYNMDAIILLNKIDLEGSEELFNDLTRYSDIGYPVLKVSVKTEEGLEDLRNILKDKCSVFVGQSGIGNKNFGNYDNYNDYVDIEIPRGGLKITKTLNIQ
jgi:50S ribosomal subunit-associated GTPase HflX